MVRCFAIRSMALLLIFFTLLLFHFHYTVYVDNKCLTSSHFFCAALHQAAKETIALAEERFVNSRHEHWQFDSAWQEMLNHATIKVLNSYL